MNNLAHRIRTKAADFIGGSFLPLLLLAFCTGAFAIDLYVSPQGNDAWPGMVAQPKALPQGGPGRGAPA